MKLKLVWLKKGDGWNNENCRVGGHLVASSFHTALKSGTYPIESEYTFNFYLPGLDKLRFSCSRINWDVTKKLVEAELQKWFESCIDQQG